MMEWQDAVESLIERTGVARYRWLASDENPDPMGREGYRRFALSQAGIVEPIPVDPAPTGPTDSDWNFKIRGCPDYLPGCCHDPVPRCSRYGISPSREQCIACLSGEDPLSIQPPQSGINIDSVLDLYGKASG